MLCFPEAPKIRNYFPKAGFLYLDESKKENQKKSYSETRRRMVET